MIRGADSGYDWIFSHNIVGFITAYLDTDEFHRHVERPKPPVRTCVELIKAAGGKASLAHPYQIGLDNDALERIVRELAGYGLDAIECYYPRHTLKQQTFYLRLAEKYGLHVTGGSDFHGEKIKPDMVTITVSKMGRALVNAPCTTSGMMFFIASSSPVCNIGLTPFIRTSKPY